MNQRLWLSAAFLLLANLVPLYGVLQLDWSVGSVILLFWLENLIVGLLNLLRIASASPECIRTGEKISSGLFFTLHYGMFCFVHGLFLIQFFGDQQSSVAGSELPGIVLRIVTEEQLFWPLAGIALSHLFSYYLNYIGNGEYRQTSAKKLMGQPYKRIMIMHATIIFGGLAVQALGQPVAALLFLLGIKITIDLVAHWQEHREDAQLAADRT